MRRLLLSALVLASACASPQQRAAHQYQVANAECTKYSRREVAHLVSSARAFWMANHRWPYNLDEASQFALEHKLPLDELAFHDTTFASMADGSLEIQYHFDCARFDPVRFHFYQPGSVKVLLQNH